MLQVEINPLNEKYLFELLVALGYVQFIIQENELIELPFPVNVEGDYLFIHPSMKGKFCIP